MFLIVFRSKRSLDFCGKHPSEVEMSETLRVLVIGEQPDDVRRIENLLVEAEETSRLPVVKINFDLVLDLAAGLDRLEHHHFDALHLGLSDPDDLTKLADLRQAYPNLPIIIGVTPANESLALLAITQGASDYWLHGQSNLRDLAALYRHTLAGARLNAGSRRLNWLEENINEIIWRADPDLRLVEVTSSVQRLAGFLPEEALKMTLLDLIAPSSRQDLTEALAEFYSPDPSATSRCAVTFELEHLRKEGKNFWSEISLKVLRDSQGILMGFTGSTRDVSSRHAVQEKLDYISVHDSLTGLFNRTYFEEELKRLEFSRLYPITILLADLEGLKAINFENGLEKGDELLKQVASFLRLTFRSEDMVARIGGDEFIVIMPRTHARAAGKALQRVVNLVENYNQENLEMPLHLSIGVATAEQGQSLMATLKIAGTQKFSNDKVAA
jgi:diguanylate cyclase (GGDEF)-like protein/PAS domain S-box-containing protein